MLQLYYSWQLEECQDSLNQLKSLPFHEQPSTSESVSDSASKAQGSLVAMAGELTSRLLLDIFREQPVPDRDVSLTAAVPRVWSSLTTLYAPRQQLELTARLRTIVEHSCIAIRQASVCLSVCRSSVCCLYVSLPAYGNCLVDQGNCHRKEPRATEKRTEVTAESQLFISTGKVSTAPYHVRVYLANLEH